MNNDELNDIARIAIQTLRRQGRDALDVSLESPAVLGGRDAVARLRLSSGRELRVCVEARRSLRPAQLPELHDQLTKRRRQGRCDQGMVVASYIPRPLAEKLREQNIWFADAAGNAYLEIPGKLLVYAVGGRPTTPALTVSPWPSAAAAKVFLALLVRGPEVFTTYRELAQVANVSLGLVSRTITALVAQGILRRPGRGRYTVAEAAKLLELWCEGYARRLRPQLFLGRFRAPGGADFTAILDTIRNERRRVVVGGELAADLLTGHLRAGSAHLYLNRTEASDLRAALRLAPSENGNIELHDLFSPEIGIPVGKGALRVAHPALVYAELMTSEDVRCGEAALRLKETHLPWMS